MKKSKASEIKTYKKENKESGIDSQLLAFVSKDKRAIIPLSAIIVFLAGYLLVITNSPPPVKSLRQSSPVNTSTAPAISLSQPTTQPLSPSPEASTALISPSSQAITSSPQAAPVAADSALANNGAGTPEDKSQTTSNDDPLVLLNAIDNSNITITTDKGSSLISR
ncbi:MAG TPA: hypothetical protein VFN51_01655 [Candidatus Saccharimonadales bacterium]|nr:hypothetical protein [Candidatus Saccharimonadales bacterium]